MSSRSRLFVFLFDCLDRRKPGTLPGFFMTLNGPGLSLHCEYSDAYSGMTNILDNAPSSQPDPMLAVRKAPHAQVWSVWAVLGGSPSEEIFEGSSEDEASNWIKTGGQAWLEERRRKRSDLSRY
jgi:hypothetical protein